MKKLIVLITMGLTAHALVAQNELSVSDPRPAAKGGIALSIQLGSATTNVLRPSPGGTTRMLGTTRALSLGLHFTRPNGTRHILSLDRYRHTSAIGLENPSNVLGSIGGATYLGYEFRKYFPIQDLPLKWYAGAWTQLQGVAAAGGVGATEAVVRANFGLSAGMEYDISKRFFVEGGVRAGLMSFEYARDARGFGAAQVGTGRFLYEGKAGIGFRF
jgi:hypothetical protein